MAAIKTPTCRRGHELTADNVYMSPVGERQCKACRLLAKNKYRNTQKGKQAEIRSHRHSNQLRPLEQKARSLLSSALRNGTIIKPDVCSVGTDCWGRIEGHHEDYTKPLEVLWLCMGHHRELHNG